MFISCPNASFPTSIIFTLQSLHPIVPTLHRHVKSELNGDSERCYLPADGESLRDEASLHLLLQIVGASPLFLSWQGDSLRRFGKGIKERLVTNTN